MSSKQPWHLHCKLTVIGSITESNRINKYLKLMPSVLFPISNYFPPQSTPVGSLQTGHEVVVSPNRERHTPVNKVIDRCFRNPRPAIHRFKYLRCVPQFTEQQTNRCINDEKTTQNPFPNTWFHHLLSSLTFRNSKNSFVTLVTKKEAILPNYATCF